MKFRVYCNSRPAAAAARMLRRGGTEWRKDKVLSVSSVTFVKAIMFFFLCVFVVWSFVFVSSFGVFLAEDLCLCGVSVWSWNKNWVLFVLVLENAGER